MSRRNVHLILAVMLISLVCYQKAGTARNRQADTFVEAMNTIEQAYLEPVDRRTLFEAAMKGMTSVLDPHSSYIPPRDYSEFQVNLEQEFGGIGIQVTVDEDKRLTVLSPLVGTPAYEAGVLAGDKILAIDGKSTEGYGIEDAVKLLRGNPGKIVTLTVRHQGEESPVEIPIERAVIQIETVLGDTHNADGSWNFFLEGYPHLGYVRVTSFSERTADELRTAINTLLEGGMQGLILDLRNNPGGLLQTAIEVCDMFIDKGRIVSTRGRKGVVREVANAHAAGTFRQDFPLAMLVSRYSASASEIVAACLQDHHRAVIVGERTFGKGTVQNLIPLEQGRSALKLTIASYWRPSGKNIDRKKGDPEDADWGVTPDKGYHLKLSDEQMRKLIEWRRRRDIVGRPKAPADQDADQVLLSEIDPQLQRAIDYVKQSTSHNSQAKVAETQNPGG